jgi:dihydroxyacid dehydratase/phosphogluconate dehydratase
MEDLHEAGGLPALLSQIGDLLDLSCATVGGGTLGEQIKDAEVFGDDVIRPRNRPLSSHAGTCVLYGNLAPNGCVIKSLAAENRLANHRGRAVVFDDYPSLKANIHDPDLDIDENSVLILRNAGPLGAPGFPEWGMLPIPKKLLQSGVTDLVRLSDARMSGTSYGTCVLHIAPESAAGGPLALVQTGDEIEINVQQRRIHWHVTDTEIERRRASHQPPDVIPPRGYRHLYAKHVTQADQGCDFDFLEGRSPGDEPGIH